MSQLLRQTWLTLSIIIILFVFRIYIDHIPFWQHDIRLATDTLLWLFFALLFTKIIRVVIWEHLISKLLGREPPRLLMQLGNVVIFFLAISGIIAFTFDQSLTGFWTASGAVGIVIGFALRNLIQDTFSGLAIHIENPFSVGDWIICATGDKDYFGRVEETNWRTTRLWTSERNRVVLPNSLISTTALTNLSKPNDQARFDLDFSLDYTVSHERASRVLKAAVQNVTHVDGIYSDPAPFVFLEKASSYGLVYSVRFFINVKQILPDKAKSFVIASVMEHFRHAGLTFAYPKQDIYHTDLARREKTWDNEDDLVSQLKQLSIFSELDDSVLVLLSRKMDVQFLNEGITLVTQGDPGDSMFIVAEGLLEVAIKNETQEEAVKVGYLSPGNFFGEKSLLTGVPRSATIRTAVDTVVCEIRKEIMSELLEQDMEVAKILSRAITQRDQLNKDAMTQSGSTLAENTDDQGKALLNRIVKFFGMQS